MHPIWNETTEEEYDYCLGALPPAAMRSGAFLLGEPYDWRICTVSNKPAHTYHAYKQAGGKFFKARQPITISEFNRIA